MNQDEPAEPVGPHTLGGSLSAFWDQALPLPIALLDALRLRFPEAPWLPQPADRQPTLDPPPAWLAALAPGVVECFVGYADDCELRDDWAGVQAVVPQLARLASVIGQLARASEGRLLLAVFHRARSCSVRALYIAGRYAEAWAQAADLPAALATQLSAAECREEIDELGLFASCRQAKRRL